MNAVLPQPLAAPEEDAAAGAGNNRVLLWRLAREFAP